MKKSAWKRTSSPTSALVALFILGACCAPLPDAPPRKTSAPPRVSGALPFTEEYRVWRDGRRGRDVPVKLYVPAVPGRHPVVVVSHGIGEDRQSYAYLGRALARNGFLAVHITHAGTDRAVLQQGYRHLYEATRQRLNWIDRSLDVTFVLDRLGAREALVAGHSAGAFTAFSVAGLRLRGGERFRDRRVRAIVAMSMPRMGAVVPAGGYDSVETPALNITGTCDSSIIYRTRPRDRRIPFDSTRARRQYLVTLRGVNHNTFSNTTDENQQTVAALTVLFARAFLTGDAAARAWFDDAGRTPLMTVERK